MRQYSRWRRESDCRTVNLTCGRRWTTCVLELRCILQRGRGHWMRPATAFGWVLIDRLPPPDRIGPQCSCHCSHFVTCRFHDRTQLHGRISAIREARGDFGCPLEGFAVNEEVAGELSLASR